MWDDNNGDYGNEKCSGYLKQQNKQVELEIFCETISKIMKNFGTLELENQMKVGHR